MDLDAVRRSLEDRLRALTGRVTRIESHLRDPGSKDSQERAAELENDEVLEQLSESERGEIAQIRAALDRIQAGTYSACATCGEDIDPRRLEAVPYTRFCIGCAP